MQHALSWGRAMSLVQTCRTDNHGAQHTPVWTGSSCGSCSRYADRPGCCVTPQRVQRLVSVGPGNDHEHGGACQRTRGRSFTQLAHRSAHEPHPAIRTQRSTLTCSAPTNLHHHTLPGRDANLESISTAAQAPAPAPARSRASRSPVSPKACNPTERQYTGFAHGIHLGKTKI
jgi:hypothetical protein